MTFHPILRFLLLVILLLFTGSLPAQSFSRTPFLEPADSLDRTRFWACLGLGGAIYAGASIALYHAWYKNYELTGFHTFDDSAEWLQMDKMGHLFTTYTESRIAYKGARWTGMQDRQARWVGVGVGMLLQSTIEVMDGFSEKWGFSWSDMGYNALGAGLFLGQEMLWSEQRILFKVSNTSPTYSSARIWSEDQAAFSSPVQRANELFGRGVAETFLKDYNGMTVWASVNPASFSSTGQLGRFWPRWLNVAAGYGAENLFGGFENTWEDENGQVFTLSPTDFPRYRQFYLSLDVDFNRIQTRNRFLRTLFTVINWIKVPAPSIELNSRGGFKFHPFYW